MCATCEQAAVACLPTQSSICYVAVSMFPCYCHDVQTNAEPNSTETFVLAYP